jgi:hypothetical protein
MHSFTSISFIITIGVVGFVLDRLMSVVERRFKRRVSFDLRFTIYDCGGRAGGIKIFAALRLVQQGSQPLFRHQSRTITAVINRKS